jgi:hypothetical protein
VLAAGVGVGVAAVVAGALDRGGSAPPGASRVVVIGCAAVTAFAAAGWLVAGGAGICAVTVALPARNHQARPAAITSALTTSPRLSQHRGDGVLLDGVIVDVFMVYHLFCWSKPHLRRAHRHAAAWWWPAQPRAKAQLVRRFSDIGRDAAHHLVAGLQIG